MSYKVICTAVATPPHEKSYHVECFVTFEEIANHYETAKEYFEWKFVRHDGKMALEQDPSLSKQVHVVGEALVHELGFRERDIKLKQASSHVEGHAQMPERAPDFTRDDAKLWITIKSDQAA